MNLVVPAALGFGALVPILVVFYLLKVRRHDLDVSSTYLWEQLQRDLVALSPSAVLGDISAGNSATANFEVAVDGGFACLGTFTLPIAISATEGNAAGSLDVDVGSAGNCTVCVDAADLIFRDGFESPAP